jgi:ring-1,2-phenylacetyl-CoA epoxidase subunit PaaB
MTGPADGAPGAGFTAEGGHGAVPTAGVPSGLPADPPGATAGPGPAQAQPPRRSWPLWEVFVRGKRGLNHVHVGSLRAADERMALQHARDVYTRRNEGVSIWVVRSDAVTASSPSEKDPFFAPAGDKVYRHPTFYPIPEDVPHL